MIKETSLCMGCMNDKTYDGPSDERIIRFLTFKQDKFAVEYSEKRRAKLSNKQEE